MNADGTGVVVLLNTVTGGKSGLVARWKEDCFPSVPSAGLRLP